MYYGCRVYSWSPKVAKNGLQASGAQLFSRRFAAQKKEPFLTQKLASRPRSSPVCLACPLIPHGMVTCRRCFWVALATAVGYAAFAGPKTGPFFDPKFGSAFFRTECRLLRALQLIPSCAGPNFGPEYGPVSRGGAQNRAHNVDPDLVPQPGVKKQKNRNDSINLLVPCISSTEQLARPSCGATEGEQGHEAGFSA